MNTKCLRDWTANLSGICLASNRKLFFVYSRVSFAAGYVSEYAFQTTLTVVQNSQHDPRTEPEATDEHLALIEIVQLLLVVLQPFEDFLSFLRQQRRQIFLMP